MTAHTLPDDPVYAFTPAYDFEDTPQQIRIVFQGMEGYVPTALVALSIADAERLCDRLLFRTLFDGGFPRLFRAVDAQMSHIILALPDRGTVFDDVFSARLMKARGDRFARLVGM